MSPDGDRMLDVQLIGRGRGVYRVDRLRADDLLLHRQIDASWTISRTRGPSCDSRSTLSSGRSR